jgi:predicted ATPase/DNA-binding CsgD family transcriptional regulator
MLLVLDNCEHILSACAQLATELLVVCPRLRILATSRERLRVGGEVTWRVPSLATPDPRATLAPADLLAFPAVRLFTERAQAVLPGFTLGKANAPVVAGVCARLEGLPLALELAAARVSALSLPQILERLDDGVRLLIGGSRTSPTRQQTIRATLDWSYGLLSEQERAVFRRLAVFAADCSLDAAEAICSAGEVTDGDVLDMLHHLVDKSLVVVDEQSGRSRYRLLEPIRQYAREQLVAGGELQETRRRHALYFLTFCEQRDRASNVGGPLRPAATAALLQEYPNIRLALGWSVESGEVQIGLRLARTVSYLWFARGYPGEGLAWLQQLLALRGADQPTPARAACLLSAGRLATVLGHIDTGRTFFEAGLQLASTTGDPHVQWLGQHYFALYASMRGNFDTAIRHQRVALATARAFDNRVEEAISLTLAAELALFQGHFSEAQALAEDARRAAHAVGEEWIEGLTVVYFGLLALQRGDHARARHNLERGLNMCQRQGDPRFSARALDGLGLLAVVEGRSEDAHACLAESLRLVDEIGNRPAIADTLESFTALAASLSRPEAALQLAGAAAAFREAIGAAQSPFRRDLVNRWHPSQQQGEEQEFSSRNWAIGQAMTIQEAIALALTLHQSDMRLSDSQQERSPYVAGLTSRESEVLRLLAKGRSNKEIAAELVLSVRTVERHIANLYAKIDARGKADATAYAIRHGLV